jgi:hypothetical protein
LLKNKYYKVTALYGIKTEIPLTVLLKHQHKSIADCPEAPYVPKAEIIEKFGLYRSVGRGNKYR